MARSLDEYDYYALLGVPQQASVDDIKAGFREFARRFHPDRFVSDPARADKATRVYARGTEAYRVLTHLERRRAYDEQLRSGQLRFRPETARRSLRQSGSPGGPESCSPKARPFVIRAEQALQSDDFQTARLNLQIALQHDSENEGLRRRLADLEAQSKARRSVEPP
jgi:curved DNA-binding protein CbpA